MPRLTLRDFGFTSCEPLPGEKMHALCWQRDRGIAYCPLCGAQQQPDGTFRGGSVDYPIEPLVREALEKKLARPRELP